MLSQEQIKKIEELTHARLSKLEIADRLGISVGSVYKYANLFQTIEPQLKTENPPPLQSPIKISKILEPYIHLINEQINNKITSANKIYKALLASGFQGSYILVNNFVRQYEFTHGPKKYHRITQKVETDPGVQAQVDWGHFGKITIDGRVLNLYIFVYVLSYSRMMYAEFTVSQKQRTFLECHIHAFEKLGVPKNIRYDNTKTVVISRNKITKEPFFNFDLLNFARYYKFEPEACKPYYPQSKGKVDTVTFLAPEKVFFCFSSAKITCFN